MGWFDGLHLSKPKLVLYTILLFPSPPLLSHLFGLVRRPMPLYQADTKTVTSMYYKRQFDVYFKIGKRFCLSYVSVEIGRLFTWLHISLQWIWNFYVLHKLEMGTFLRNWHFTISLIENSFQSKLFKCHFAGVLVSWIICTSVVCLSLVEQKLQASSLKPITTANITFGLLDSFQPLDIAIIDVIAKMSQWTVCIDHKCNVCPNKTNATTCNEDTIIRYGENPIKNLSYHPLWLPCYRLLHIRGGWAINPWLKRTKDKLLKWHLKNIFISNQDWKPIINFQYSYGTILNFYCTYEFLLHPP